MNSKFISLRALNILKVKLLNSFKVFANHLIVKTDKNSEVEILNFKSFKS